MVPELIELAAKGGDDAKSGDNDAVGIGHCVELILIALTLERGRREPWEKSRKSG